MLYTIATTMANVERWHSSLGVCLDDMQKILPNNRDVEFVTDSLTVFMKTLPKHAVVYRFWNALHPHEELIKNWRVAEITRQLKDSSKNEGGEIAKMIARLLDHHESVSEAHKLIVRRHFQALYILSTRAIANKECPDHKQP